jgi:hypothetical protein
MKNLFDVAAVEEIRERMAQLQPGSARQWGTMKPAQALAHISAQFEMIAGLKFPPRSLAGRVFGRLAKPVAFNDKPFRPNMPTDEDLVVSDDRDLDAERQRLQRMIDRFAGNPPGIRTASSDG